MSHDLSDGEQHCPTQFFESREAAVETTAEQNDH